MACDKTTEPGIAENKSDAGWLRGQTTRRRIHRRSDGGPERRQVLRRGTRAPLCMLHRNPPLVRQDRITSRSCRARRFTLSINRFLPAFWAVITGSKGSRLSRGVGRPASTPLGALLAGDMRYWQPRLIGAKTSGTGGLAPAVGEDDCEIGDDDRANRP